jgi:hypothetical protein
MKPRRFSGDLNQFGIGKRINSRWAESDDGLASKWATTQAGPGEGAVRWAVSV